MHAARHPPPPTPPRGWHPAPPDYVGVGTPRSGTTWWDALIAAHPRVSRPSTTPAETHFFDERWQLGLADGDIERYHALFARPEGHLSGEWTPSYMLDVWTPPLLREAAPEARLLVLLRDPVERFRSGRSQTESAVATGSTPRAAANAAFSRGLYADQLLRLWRSFPRQQVLVLQFERCLADPAGQLRRTYAFLGLDTEPSSSLDLAPPMPGPRVPEIELSSLQERTLARRYAPENARLAELVPDLDLALWAMPA